MAKTHMVVIRHLLLSNPIPVISCIINIDDAPQDIANAEDWAETRCKEHIQEFQKTYPKAKPASYYIQKHTSDFNGVHSSEVIEIISDNK